MGFQALVARNTLGDAKGTSLPGSGYRQNRAGQTHLLDTSDATFYGCAGSRKHENLYQWQQPSSYLYSVRRGPSTLLSPSRRAYSLRLQGRLTIGTWWNHPVRPCS